MLRLGPIITTNVTEDPTNIGPSSVYRRSGLGRRSWMEQDPGRRHRRTKKEIEAAKAELRHYKELYQRGKHERQPQNSFGEGEHREIGRVRV